MADGTTKAVEHVSVGDEVLSCYRDQAATSGLSRVSDVSSSGEGQWALDHHFAGWSLNVTDHT